MPDYYDIVCYTLMPDYYDIVCYTLRNYAHKQKLRWKHDENHTCNISTRTENKRVTRK